MVLIKLSVIENDFPWIINSRLFRSFLNKNILIDAPVCSNNEIDIEKLIEVIEYWGISSLDLDTYKNISSNFSLSYDIFTAENSTTLKFKAFYNALIHDRKDMIKNDYYDMFLWFLSCGKISNKDFIISCEHPNTRIYKDFLENPEIIDINDSHLAINVLLTENLTAIDLVVNRGLRLTHNLYSNLIENEKAISLMYLFKRVDYPNNLNNHKILLRSHKMCVLFLHFKKLNNTFLKSCCYFNNLEMLILGFQNNLEWNGQYCYYVSDLKLVKYLFDNNYTINSEIYRSLFRKLSANSQKRNSYDSDENNNDILKTIIFCLKKGVRFSEDSKENIMKLKDLYLVELCLSNGYNLKNMDKSNAFENIEIFTYCLTKGIKFDEESLLELTKMNKIDMIKILLTKEIEVTRQSEIVSNCHSIELLEYFESCNFNMTLNEEDINNVLDNRDPEILEFFMIRGLEIDDHHIEYCVKNGYISLVMFLYDLKPHMFDIFLVELAEKHQEKDMAEYLRMVFNF